MKKKPMSKKKKIIILICCIAAVFLIPAFIIFDEQNKVEAGGFDYLKANYDCTVTEIPVDLSFEIDLTQPMPSGTLDLYKHSGAELLYSQAAVSFYTTTDFFNPADEDLLSDKPKNMKVSLISLFHSGIFKCDLLVAADPRQNISDFI